jgi:hypothetical protein
MDGLAEILSQDTDLVNFFLSLIKIKESHGYLPPKLPRILILCPEFDRKLLREKVKWLRDLGFLVKGKHEMHMTQMGLDTLYLAIKEQLETFLKRLMIIDKPKIRTIFELKKASRMPSSILIKALKDFEERGLVVCGSIHEKRCELFWIAPPLKDIPKELVEDMQEKWENLLSQVLKILGSFHHGLGSIKVLELLREKGVDADYQTVRLLLQELEKRGKVQKQEGDAWLYRWDQRILDTLCGHPCEAFTLEELIKKTSIPPIQMRWVESNILKYLEGKGRVVKIYPERWVYPFLDYNDKRRRLQSILKSDCKRFILKVLDRQGGSINVDRLSALTRSFIIDLMKGFGLILGTTQEIYEEVITEMLKNGKIVKKGEKFLRM